MTIAEIIRCYGGSLTNGALNMHFVRDVRPNVKLIQEALDRGEDPIGVTMLENCRPGKPGKRQTYSYLHSWTQHIFLLSDRVSNAANSGAQIDALPAEVARCVGKSATVKSTKH
jgi:hypothetical protein